MIDLIAIDLDGTLLKDDKSISKRNKQALHQAVSEGIEIVICSGRPCRAVEPILEELDLNNPDHYSIAYNGGIIYKNQSRDVIHSKHLTRQETEAIWQSFKKLKLPVACVEASDSVYYFDELSYSQSHYPTQQPLLDHLQIDPKQIKQSTNFYKIVISTKEASILERQTPNIDPAIPSNYSLMKSHPHQLEIMPKGVDKGAALNVLANHLDIPMDRVMGIGDEDNDLGMLEAVGHPVAMANASPKAKNLAKYITLSNEEDGVAHIIEEVIAKRSKN